MAPVISDRIRFGQARQQAMKKLQQARQDIVASFLELIQCQKEMEHALRAAVREGVERSILAESITPELLADVERTLKMFRENSHLIDDPNAAAAVHSQIVETEQFLIWLRELLAVVTKPIPPFDETQLPPLPEGPPQGFTSLAEARQAAKARNQS